MNLPEILKQDQTKQDLFRLPQQALAIIFGDSATCLSEFELFRAITERIQATKDDFTTETIIEESKEVREESNSKQSEVSSLLNEGPFLKKMLKYVRLPLINMRQLVTDIKFSGYFDDQAIFEAL